MSWFSFLGGQKATEKALDTVSTAVHGVIDGVDKLIFTDEERSEASQRITDTWLKAVEATANESSARSITRRVLAVMSLGVFLILLTSSALIYPMDAAWSEYLLRCAGQLSSLVLSISIFYFGYYGIHNIIKTVKHE